MDKTTKQTTLAEALAIINAGTGKCWDYNLNAGIEPSSTDETKLVLCYVGTVHKMKDGAPDFEEFKKELGLDGWEAIWAYKAEHVESLDFRGEVTQ